MKNSNPLLSASKASLTYPEQAYGFFQTAKSLGFPIACWRMPNNPVQHFIADCSGQLQWLKPELSELPMGFLVAPFQNHQGKAHFMQAHLHYQWDEQRQQSRVEQVLDPQLQDGIQQFSAQWQQESETRRDGDYYCPPTLSDAPDTQAH